MKRELTRLEKLEALAAKLEAENAVLRFNAAARPMPQPIPARHGWDVE